MGEIYARPSQDGFVQGGTDEFSREDIQPFVSSHGDRPGRLMGWYLVMSPGKATCWGFSLGYGIWLFRGLVFSLITFRGGLYVLDKDLKF